MTLSNLRDALINAKEALEEKQLILDQSKYESPAVKRQATLDLEKAVRNLEQEQRNYKIKKQQENYKITRALSEVSRAQSSVDEINQLFTSLDIKAPKPGMVIYSFDRLGNKIKVGSTVSRWSPTIAELPDLSTMISKTFINEVDISKIKIDQMVTVGVDAFPEKSFRGKVIEVANIGQVLPGGDSKVFEVTIKVFGSDKELRPAMTTSNVIKTFQTDSVICIPLDAVFQNDSVQYVYSFQRTVLKKIVELGSENENYVIVKRGVDKGEELFLNEPLGGAVLPWVGIDIYEDLKVKKAIEAENMKKKPNERKKSNREGRKRSSSNSGNVNRNSN